MPLMGRRTVPAIIVKPTTNQLNISTIMSGGRYSVPTTHPFSGTKTTSLLFSLYTTRKDSILTYGYDSDANLLQKGMRIILSANDFGDSRDSLRDC